MTLHFRAASVRRRADEWGQAGAEVIVGGVVMIIAITLVLANVWAVLDTKMMASDAARAAAQAYIEEDDATTANAAAQASATRQLQARFGSAWRAIPVVDRFGRCASTAIRVEIKVGLIAVPFIGSVGGTKTVSSTHRTRIDPYRSGVLGEAACDD
jgi:hypothetical protein